MLQLHLDIPDGGVGHRFRYLLLPGVADTAFAKHQRSALTTVQLGGKQIAFPVTYTHLMPLRCEIFEMMREYVGANLAKKVTNVVDVLKLSLIHI